MPFSQLPTARSQSAPRRAPTTACSRSALRTAQAGPTRGRAPRSPPTSMRYGAIFSLGGAPGARRSASLARTRRSEMLRSSRPPSSRFTRIVNLEDGGRELRSISERLVRAREAERRAPGAPPSEKIAPYRIEVGGERGARPRVGPAWAVRKAEREHAMVGARLGADCDRAVGS